MATQAPCARSACFPFDKSDAKSCFTSLRHGWSRWRNVISVPFVGVRLMTVLVPLSLILSLAISWCVRVCDGNVAMFADRFRFRFFPNVAAALHCFLCVRGFGCRSHLILQGGDRPM